MAERLCSGLQIRLGRFDSDPRLQYLARRRALSTGKHKKSAGQLNDGAAFSRWSRFVLRVTHRTDGALAAGLNAVA